MERLFKEINKEILNYRRGICRKKSLIIWSCHLNFHRLHLGHQNLRARNVPMQEIETTYCPRFCVINILLYTFLTRINFVLRNRTTTIFTFTPSIIIIVFFILYVFVVAGTCPSIVRHVDEEVVWVSLF